MDNDLSKVTKVAAPGENPLPHKDFMLFWAKETVMRPEEITKRIQHITEEIRTLQQSLDELSNTGSEAERHHLIEDCLQPEMIVDFKAAVDNLRIFLWSYLEAAARQSGGQVMDYALQAYRIRRATEMLEMLNKTAQRAGEPLPVVCSFFERIQNIAHLALEKHENSRQM